MVDVIKIAADRQKFMTLTGELHVRRLRQIRRRVGGEVATRLLLALIVSRIDYCID